MQLIDTHCHLDFPVFDQDREALLDRCRALGVTEYIIPAIAENNWTRVIALADQHIDFFYGLGVHPWYAGEQREGVMDRLRALVMSQPAGLVAIGECGLDLRSHVPQEGQLALFEAQIRLASDADLPLMVHSVRANDTVAKVLRRFKPPRGGVIHAFSGSLQQAEAFWQLGFRLGVGGVISFERANKTRDVFKVMPLEALVLETDSPDMPLQSEQGARNTPESLPKIAAILMDLRDEPARLVADMLLCNARNLFHHGT
ncbi:TatD family hydrolase [Aeromonas sp. MdU4]|uniref:TatD family hydrolase n=1 Tax=Aeromonas sp. MdU4 TaxID=3342819 RepID=UPI0035B9C48C